MTLKAIERAVSMVATREMPKTVVAATTKQAQSAPSAAAASGNTNLRFHVDEDSGKTVMAWVDDRGKVLRQIPSEEAMAVAKAIDRYQGVFVNRKA